MFIIDDGFLSIKFNDHFTKKYFYIENFNKEKINNILHVLNSNIHNVIINDNIIKKTTTIKIKEKDYIIFKIFHTYYWRDREDKYKLEEARKRSIIKTGEINNLLKKAKQNKLLFRVKKSCLSFLEKKKTLTLET